MIEDDLIFDGSNRERAIDYFNHVLSERINIDAGCSVIVIGGGHHLEHLDMIESHKDFAFMAYPEVRNELNEEYNYHIPERYNDKARGVLFALVISLGSMLSDSMDKQLKLEEAKKNLNLYAEEHFKDYIFPTFIEEEPYQHPFQVFFKEVVIKNDKFIKPKKYKTHKRHEKGKHRGRQQRRDR